MHIERKDIEIVVQVILNEQLQEIIESLKLAAYSERALGGSLEHAIAGAFERVAQAVKEGVS